MALSSDLISQLVKAAKPVEKKPTEATVYGTAVVQNEVQYVQLDGSSVLTPVSSTVKMRNGERVVVQIKDHTAMVTGNMTTKTARSDDVDDLVNAITEAEILIAGKVSTEELDAEKARIDELVAANATITGRVEASEALIDELQTNDININGTLTAHDAEIKKLAAEKVDSTFAEITYATIANLEATNAQVNNLEATYGDFASLTAEQLAAIDAEITNLDTKYAKIDFTNIGDATIEYLFARSGLIENITISDGTITGTLVGVTIKGDIIEGGTVVADKLVVQGEDGLYYKLNTDGATIEAEQTEYNSLNGRVITAKSITASKVSVDDLVAFGATIGGFNISRDSLFSGVKESVENSTSGVYLGSDGQVAFGNADNYLKFYAIYTYYTVLYDEATGVYTRSDVEIEMAVGTIVEDAATEDGHQVYSVTAEDGMVSYFCRVATDYKLAISADSILFGSSSKYSMDDVKRLTDHVHIGTYQDPESGEVIPCVELSEEDSTFKMRLTNKNATFVDGINDSTVIDSDGIETENLRVKNDIRHYDYIWRRRSNGNLGLMWMEVTD